MVPASDPVTIKVYGNRRLYRPTIGRYVTFDELFALAKNGTGVVLRNAETGADITALTLSQIPTEN